MKNIFQLKIKSLNKNILILYKNFLNILFKKLNIRYSVISLPTKVKKMTLLKSPHVYKKAREQFQISTSNTTYYIYSIVNSKDIKYILTNKPSILKIKLIRRIV